jgi:hypothetical protein
MAACMSSAVPAGTEPTDFSVAGLITSADASDVDARHEPSMYCSPYV